MLRRVPGHDASCPLDFRTGKKILLQTNGVDYMWIVEGFNMFKFGIEHEVAFLDQEDQFTDFDTASFTEFKQIIASLPTYEADRDQLVIGDAGIRVKRWYMEGLERFDPAGNLLTCLIKGLEIRTAPHDTIMGAVNELTTSFRLLAAAVATKGLTPVLTSFHPYRTKFVPDPPFNAYEEQLLHLSPEDLSALLSMLTYGPDLSISYAGLATDTLLDIGRKFTYYSPYIIPFTFSSPFYAGKLWDGLSVRTFLRTGLRPAALVFLEQRSELIDSNPSLTKLARIPAEVGRIEFKACDSCDNFLIYAGMLALLKGLMLDTTLTGRASIPDTALHQRTARQGFANAAIATGAQKVLQAAAAALSEDEDLCLLAPLQQMLTTKELPILTLLGTFQTTASIETALRQSYARFK
jgi:hypothetical protein